jgi:Golgi nucleoside diphosphatase
MNHPPWSASSPEESVDPTWQYAVVIDAGSSGSRALVYAYSYGGGDRRRTGSTSFQDQLPIIRKASDVVIDGTAEADPSQPSTSSSSGEWQMKVEPGISTFGGKPNEVGPTYLQRLLDFALGVVPPAAHRSTPIFLYATAGVRLLAEDERRQLLDHTCHYIKQNAPFIVGLCEDHVNVISGEMEGIYGWLAVNYLLKGFTKQQAPSELDSNGHDGAGSGGTFGFLDMGGASAQIAFEPTKRLMELHRNDLYNLTLRGMNIQYNIQTM